MLRPILCTLALLLIIPAGAAHGEDSGEESPMTDATPDTASAHDAGEPEAAQSQDGDSPEGPLEKLIESITSDAPCWRDYPAPPGIPKMSGDSIVWSRPVFDGTGQGCPSEA